MFDLNKKFTFQAGHTLERHEGRCQRPHGHSYTLTVTLRSSLLQTTGPETNMICDLDRISAVVQEHVLSHVDHRWLNEALETESPTTEHIAYWIYHILKPHLPKLYCVAVESTPTASVRYCPTG